MLIGATQSPRRDIELNKRGEVGRLVEGKNFKCEKSNFEVNASEGYRGALMMKQPVADQRRYALKCSGCAVACEYYFRKCQRIKNCNDPDETGRWRRRRT
jgi:hypothetical protein